MFRTRLVVAIGPAIAIPAGGPMSSNRCALHETPPREPLWRATCAKRRFTELGDPEQNHLFATPPGHLAWSPKPPFHDAADYRPRVFSALQAQSCPFVAQRGGEGKPSTQIKS